jgi:murein DD-endopeptidase MepM/ murein hydrolase activator NlpD
VRARPTQPAPQASAFHYVFPVRSEGKISYGRFHHDYPATDMFCPIGSQFVAPTDGVVDYVSREDRWDPKVNDGATRGGLSVAIVGDDGVRYYGSHLSQVADRIEPGVRVTAGQLLGLTGRSGDARGTDPHLHFGISHPTAPDDWAVRRGEIPPYNYLKAWEKGEDVTPVLTR